MSAGDVICRRYLLFCLHRPDLADLRASSSFTSNYFCCIFLSNLLGATYFCTILIYIYFLFFFLFSDLLACLFKSVLNSYPISFAQLDLPPVLRDTTLTTALWSSAGVRKSSSVRWSCCQWILKTLCILRLRGDWKANAEAEATVLVVRLRLWTCLPEGEWASKRASAY